MRIEPPSRGKKRKKLLPLILILAAGFFLLRARPVSSPSLIFEIQNLNGTLQVAETPGRWQNAAAGGSIPAGAEIQTGPKSEADLRFNQAVVRLKPQTFLKIQSSGNVPQLHLKSGSLLIYSDNEPLEVLVPGALPVNENSGLLNLLTARMIARTGSGSFLISSLPQNQYAEVSVLQGSVDVRSGIFRKLSVKESETAESKGFSKIEAVPVSQEDWQVVREAYDLVPESAAQEAEQLDLSKEAGSLFKFVFDHGTFYNKQWGFCKRRFERPGGNPVELQIDYDVYPRGSWAGVYFKTRNLDLSKFKKITLDVRGDSSRGVPDQIRVELKSKAAVLRAFVIKRLSEDWQAQEFPLLFRKETPLTEITFIFSNEKTGVKKAGRVWLKNFNIEALEPQPVPPQEIPSDKPAESPSAG
jgi:hypothetical protein